MIDSFYENWISIYIFFFSSSFIVLAMKGIYIYIHVHNLADTFVQSNLQYFIHSYTDGGGCHARWPPAHQHIRSNGCSVSCLRAIRHADQGNWTNDLSITRHTGSAPEPQPPFLNNSHPTKALFLYSCQSWFCIAINGWRRVPGGEGSACYTEQSTMKKCHLFIYMSHYESQD